MAGRGPPGFRIPVRAVLEDFQKDLRDMREIGRRAGAETGKAVQKELQAEFRKRIGGLREALASGIIDKQQFRQLSKDVAKEFNQGVLEALKSLRKAGKDGTDEFIKLQRAIKATGVEARRIPEAVQEVAPAWKRSLSDLPGFVRGALATGVIGGFLFIAGRVTAIFRDVARVIGETLERGGDVQAARIDFGALAGTRGLSGTRVLEELRQGTRGLVSDLNLLQKATFALQAGLPVTEEKLGRMAEVSRRLARAAGRDATEAFERLVNGIAKGEQNILEELGLLTRLNDALKAWERQTGRNSDALTEAEKKTIFFNAVLAEAETKVAALGRESLTAGERIQQTSTFVANLRDRLAEAVVEAPTLANFLDSIGGTAEESAGKIDKLAARFTAFIETILGSPAGRAFARILEFEARTIGAAGGAAAGAVGRTLTGAESGSFARNLERVEAGQARRDRIAELRALKTEEEARDRLFEVQQALAAEDAKSAINVRRRNELLEEQAAIMESLRRLTAETQSGGSGGAGGEDVARRRASLQEELANRLAALTASTADEAILQIDRLEEQWIAAFGQMDEATRESFDRLRSGIEGAAEVDRLRDALDTAKSVTIEGAEGFRAYIAGVQQVRDAAEDLANAEEDGSAVRERALAVMRDADAVIRRFTEGLDRANAQGAKKLSDGLRDMGRAIPESLSDIGEMVDEVRAIAAAAEEESEKFEEGSEAREAYNKVIEEAIDLLRKLAKAAQDAGDKEEEEREKAKRAADERLRAVRDTARAIEENVRGVLQLATAFGVLDEEAAKTLETVAQIGGAIARLAAGDLSAIPSLLGGVASLFGGGRERDRARQEELQKNLDAIRDATEGLRNFGREIGAVTQAMRRAQDLLDDAARAAGLTPGSAQSLVQQREQARQGLAAARAGASGLTGDALDRLIADLEAKFTALNDALAAYDAALEEIRQGVLRDLELSRAQSTLSGRELEQRELELAQLARRADLEAAGLITDAEVLASLEATEAAERAALEARIAEAEAANILAANLRKLAADGFAETARVTQLLADQEKRLADLRKEGASAAEIAAEEEAQQAEREREGEDLANRIRRRAAERSGDTDTLLRLDQQAVTDQFMDELAALKALADAGALTAEEFEELSALLKGDLEAALEDLADAAEEAAAAQREAAEDFEDQLEIDLARAEGRDADAERKEAENRRDERRKRAEELGILEDVEGIIERLYQIELSQIGGGPAGVTAQEPTESVAVRQSMALSEQTGQSMIGLDRTRNAILRSILAELRGGIGGPGFSVSSVNPASFLPPSVTRSGGTTIQVNLGDIAASVQVGEGTDAAGLADSALAAARPKLIREIDAGLAREHIHFRRSRGIIRRP